MMMTDIAVWSLDDSWRSLRQRVSAWFRPADADSVTPDALPLAPFVDATETAHLSSQGKSARVAAVRAVLAARDGDLVRAERFFTEAVLLDPALSPAEVPTFWNLSAAAQQSAVTALSRADRQYEADELATAIVRYHQPRLAS